MDVIFEPLIEFELGNQFEALNFTSMNNSKYCHILMKPTQFYKFYKFF